MAVEARNIDTDNVLFVIDYSGMIGESLINNLNHYLRVYGALEEIFFSLDEAYGDAHYDAMTQLGLTLHAKRDRINSGHLSSALKVLEKAFGVDHLLHFSTLENGDCLGVYCCEGGDVLAVLNPASV